MSYSLSPNGPVIQSCPFSSSEDSPPKRILDQWHYVLDTWFRNSRAAGANLYLEKDYPWYNEFYLSETILEFWVRVWVHFVLAMGFGTIFELSPEEMEKLADLLKTPLTNKPFKYTRAIGLYPDNSKGALELK